MYMKWYNLLFMNYILMLKVVITLIDDGLNWSVRPLQKDLELPICPDLFHHPM